ncbi:hypothetical protein TRFO_24497 [Tritrichomonas foetus]|uniref:Uncharacterized protein n=1 Tax=Tritrichomonas foetus TaxID=1144522 RepID=A0A1J4KCB9_9EUKA|nr:hypothetical protein TRFO_24497 [Tritrichomonas foetus]|eukprot:OHT07332.1 hypothetical protein TRFO_24497 [Tritrichomonas foetus]
MSDTEANPETTVEITEEEAVNEIESNPENDNEETEEEMKPEPQQSSVEPQVEQNETPDDEKHYSNDENSPIDQLNNADSNSNISDEKVENNESNEQSTFQPEFPTSDQQNDNQAGQSDGGSFQFNFGEFPSGDDQSNQAGGGGDGAFQFSFNDFPQDGDGQAGASFTFDANDEAPVTSEEDKLYEKFISLIGNPCFDYTGRPLIEFFKHEDPTDSAAAAFSLLVGNTSK